MQLSCRGGVRQVRAVLEESKSVLKNYLLGLMVETAIIAALNVGALLLLGIDYALLLGVVAAILNLIPYVGIIIGGIFPIVIAFITKDAIWHPVSVALAFSVIQFLDNNLIVPKVVGAHVRINSIATIIAVIVGGQLWGISGMFLFIPLMAILKVVFDRVEPLKAWGMVLGDVIPAPEEAGVKKIRAGNPKTA
jgi:predicted PurR-regulated permease PerM